MLNNPPDTHAVRTGACPRLLQNYGMFRAGAVALLLGISWTCHTCLFAIRSSCQSRQWNRTTSIGRLFFFRNVEDKTRRYKPLQHTGIKRLRNTARDLWYPRIFFSLCSKGYELSVRNVSPFPFFAETPVLSTRLSHRACTVLF